MPEKPAISVVIPMYNAGDYILRSVASVFAQSFQDFEVIVVDDGSSDAGADRLRDSYGRDPRLHLITQANAGVSAARNRGLSEMKADLAAFLDADDEWLPEHLERIVETARIFPEAGIIGSGYRMLCRGGYVSETSIAGSKPRIIENYFEAAMSARYSSILTMSSCAITRNAYEALGGFVENEPYGEDTEFQARYAFRFPVACHPMVTAVYHREIAESAVGSCSRNGLRNAPLLIRRYSEWSQVDSDDPSRLESLRLYAAKLLYETAVTQIGLGKGANAMSLLNHPLLRLSCLRKRAMLAAWAARSAVGPAARLYFRLSRSRLFHRSMVSNGISFRCVSRFGR